MYVVSFIKVAAILYKTNFISAVLLTEKIGDVPRNKRFYANMTLAFIMHQDIGAMVQLTISHQHIGVADI